MIKEGDRVSRQIVLGEKERRYGTIVKKYKTSQGIGFTPIILFDIKWDNSEIIERGFMEQYLQKEK